MLLKTKILNFQETWDGYFASVRTRRVSSEITSVCISVSAGFPICLFRQFSESDLEYAILHHSTYTYAQSNC